MINGMISVLSLSDLLLLMCRTETDTCVLILYLETLANSLMSSSSFLGASLGFSMYSIMSSANSDGFIFFFSHLDFISFSSLISMARTSKTILDTSGKRGHLFLVLTLKEMLSAFHH